MSYSRHCLNTDRISDEEIHAFVDDELTIEDRQRVRSAVKHNPKLTQMICDIDQVQDWVREAYQSVPQPPKRLARVRALALFPTAVAAVALLSVGALAGWFAGSMAQTDGGGHPGIVSMQQQAASAVTASSLMATAQHRNVLLRLGSDSPEKFRETLKVAEQVLKNSAHDPGFQLEVLTNSDGLNFLRSGTTPYAQQIEALMTKYPNVHFMVCGTSLEKLRESGKKPNLLPRVTVTDSAVEQVAHRIRQGWTYLSI
ncbi:hypothetical protein A9404_07560 [Halothiobacillus diazotrophicus]|uniref:Uncharacterized protein n=1 Tax=Halothiobacillus diazotrophicus TaxID=1860122 RepID=A0A191ZH98_9GAMM|nr:DsrE family protein [Halothiobacillus diazotrophicus]ANJ67259.1 hypothetical protein A9404_07560 [Halothiobacillus diazotrophicus]